MFCRQDHGFVDSNAMSTGAYYDRQEHAHRSIVVLAFWRREHSFVPVRQEHCFGGTRIVLSTGAMLCRPQHSFIDRSMPAGVLWFWRFGGRSTVLSQSDRSMVLAVGALFRRQEHCFVDRSDAMSTGAQVYRQEHAHRINRGVDGRTDVWKSDREA